MPESVIYTAIFGDYDSLSDPQAVNEDYDYICFTDDYKLRSDIWDIRVIDLPVPNDYPRSNRYIKINPHEFLSEYKYSLYLDGNIILRGVPDIVKMLEDYSIATQKHPCRDCIYEEITECKRLGFGIVSELDKQAKDYRDTNFPGHAGLWENWAIFRKHNEPSLIKLAEEWWRHIMEYSWRDQISFPVVFAGYPVKTLSAYYLYHNEIISFKDHLRKV